MIEPDECTSLNYCKPHDHCRECSHAIYYGEVISKGRLWRFSFSPQYGVEFLTVAGPPLKKQPEESSSVWVEFEKWRMAKIGVK